MNILLLVLEHGDDATLLPSQVGSFVSNLMAASSEAQRSEKFKSKMAVCVCVCGMCVWGGKALMLMTVPQE